MYEGIYKTEKINIIQILRIITKLLLFKILLHNFS